MQGVEHSNAMDEVAEAALSEAVNYIQNSNQVVVGLHPRQLENTEEMGVAAFAAIRTHQPAVSVTSLSKHNTAQQLDNAEPNATETVTTWEMQFNKLKAYKAIHGNCKVPKTYPPDPQLGRWVNTVSFSLQ